MDPQKISRRRRPATVAAGCLAIALATSFVAAAADEPESGEADVTVRVVAEHPQPMLAGATARYRPVRLSADADRTEAILAALASRDTSLAFAETPLRDFIQAVAEKAGIDAGIDTRALADAGIDLESPVEGSSNGRRLLDAMRSMLDPHGLVAVVRHGRLLVTTLARAQDPAYLERFLYPVLPGSDPEELRDLIESTVAPESWDTVGGTATIRPLPPQAGSGLVVSQTEENHERIRGLLGGLDAAIWRAGDDDRRPRVVRTYPVADPESRDALAGRLIGLCNDALVEGQDPEASVQVVGESLVVQSTSRAFHVMAAGIITAIEGVESILIEEGGDEEAEPPATVQATSARR